MILYLQFGFKHVSMAKETTLIFPLYLFHTLIVIYQLLQYMELNFHNSQVTLNLALYLHMYY